MLFKRRHFPKANWIPPTHLLFGPTLTLYSLLKEKELKAACFVLINELGTHRYRCVFRMVTVKKFSLSESTTKKTRERDLVQVACRDAFFDMPCERRDMPWFEVKARRKATLHSLSLSSSVTLFPYSNLSLMSTRLATCFTTVRLQHRGPASSTRATWTLELGGRIVFHHPFIQFTISLILIYPFLLETYPNWFESWTAQNLGSPIKTKSPYASTNMVQAFFPPFICGPVRASARTDAKARFIERSNNNFPHTNPWAYLLEGWVFCSHLHKRHLLLSVLASLDFIRLMRNRLITVTIIPTPPFPFLPPVKSARWWGLIDRALTTLGVPCSSCLSRLDF